MLDNLASKGRGILRRVKGQHFSPEFDAWRELSPPYPVRFESLPTLDAFSNNYTGTSPSAIVREFIRTVTQEGTHWTNLSPNVSNGHFAREDWTFQFPISEGSSASIMAENTHVLRCSFDNNSNVIPENLQFINLRTLSLHLRLRGTKNPIRLINCVIGDLTLPDLSELSNQKADLRPSVEIHDCWIGTMVLHSRSIKKLTVVGGGIAQIQCPSSESANPFLGLVSFKRVFFPSSPAQARLFQGPHAYRSLYAHLKKLDNSLMANLMRSHQLRSERAEEQGFAKVANWIYGTFADYGMSPGKPICWVLGAYILAVVGCYNFDPGMLAKSDSFYLGAYSVLLDENGGRYTRSFLLPFHSIINPFGVFFDTRKIFVPTTGLGSALLTIQGLFSDILLVMTALSIRRRYKAE